MRRGGSGARDYFTMSDWLAFLDGAAGAPGAPGAPGATGGRMNSAVESSLANGKPIDATMVAAPAAPANGVGGTVPVSGDDMDAAAADSPRDSTSTTAEAAASSSAAAPPPPPDADDKSKEEAAGRAISDVVSMQ